MRGRESRLSTTITISPDLWIIPPAVLVNNSSSSFLWYWILLAKFPIVLVNLWPSPIFFIYLWRGESLVSQPPLPSPLQIVHFILCQKKKKGRRVGNGPLDTPLAPHIAHIDQGLFKFQPTLPNSNKSSFWVILQVYYFFHKPDFIYLLKPILHHLYFLWLPLFRDYCLCCIQ